MARVRHFARRDKAARAGIHLPSEDDLLAGMSFLGEDLCRDLREFAGRLAGSFGRKGRRGTPELLTALKRAEVFQDFEAIEAILDAIDGCEQELGSQTRAAGNLAGTRLRCRIYLAHMGDPAACARLAGEAARRAIGKRGSREGGRLGLFARSLAWATLSRRILETEAHLGQRPGALSTQEIDMLEADYETAISDAAADASASSDADRDKVPPSVAGDRSGSMPASPETNQGMPDRYPETCVAIPGSGNSNTRIGRDVEREFKGTIGVPLPLVAVPDLAAVRANLSERFPWACGVIDTLLSDMRNRTTVRLRSTILVGKPGSGKTRFAKDFLDALRVPWVLTPCGGMSDSTIGGTPRRWHTGEPSLPVTAIRRHACAGPGILLDEVEKASTSRHNGALVDVLIGMLGDETASRYLDPYLECECDLSHVSWLMTANEIAPLPAPLRDRCRVLSFPEPGAEQLLLLARRLLERHYVAMGHDPRWATPLDPSEIMALGSAWSGGSIRVLERLVEGLAATRERFTSWN